MTSNALEHAKAGLLIEVAQDFWWIFPALALALVGPKLWRIWTGASSAPLGTTLASGLAVALLPMAMNLALRAVGVDPERAISAAREARGAYAQKQEELEKPALDDLPRVASTFKPAQPVAAPPAARSKEDVETRLIQNEMARDKEAVDMDRGGQSEAGTWLAGDGAALMAALGALATLAGFGGAWAWRSSKRAFSEAVPAVDLDAGKKP